MILMPILYVEDVDASVEFYARLGFAPEARSRTDAWAELRAGDGAILALHRRDGDVAPLHDRTSGAPRMELSLLAERGFGDELPPGVSVARGISDEAFGRSIVLTDPDGREVQVNEHDRELYT